MRARPALRPIVAVLLACGALLAGDAPQDGVSAVHRARAEDGEPAKDAAAVTASGRSLDRALDSVLGRTPATPGTERTILFLVDVTRTLREVAFRDRLAEALARRADRLEGVAIGLARVGAKGTVVVAPSPARGPLLDDLEASLAAATSNPVRNVYADVRAAASSLRDRPGERHLVLVTLDNGDVEDDLEDTVRALTKAQVVCTVLCREAYLADSYAVSHPGRIDVPRGQTLEGGDGAWPQLPFGWVLQRDHGHEGAPAGFGPFGLSRIAAATGGRVHLVSSAGGSHSCSVLGGCPFCNGGTDHTPAHEVYHPHRVQTIAPSVAARNDVLAADAKDPWLRATLDLWKKASKEGLLSSRPTAVPGPSGLEPERRPLVPLALLSPSSLAFPRLRAQAAKLREAGERLAAEFDETLRGIDPSAGSMRHRAGADYTRVLLHLTILNLAIFEGWCEECGPAITQKTTPDLLPPEVARFSADQRVIGWSYRNDPLCHGLGVFRGRRMAGPPDLPARLDAFEKILTPYFERYDHTPFGVAVRRSGIVVLFPTVQGKYVPPPDRRGSSSESDTGTTTGGDRPSRGGGDGSSSGGGTSTPGGK